MDLPIYNFLEVLFIDFALFPKFLYRCISAFLFHLITIPTANNGVSLLLCEDYLLGLIVMVVSLFALDQKDILPRSQVWPTFIMEV